MVESMVDFGSAIANVIRQQLRQTSAQKAFEELAEPSRKRALSPRSPHEGLAIEWEGEAPSEMFKHKKMNG